MFKKQKGKEKRISLQAILLMGYGEEVYSLVTREEVRRLDFTID